MTIGTRFVAEAGVPAGGTLVAGVFEGGKLAPAVRRVLGNALDAVWPLTRFAGRKDQSLVLVRPQGLAFERLVLVGLGPEEGKASLHHEELGGAVWTALSGCAASQACVLVDGLAGDEVSASSAVARMASGALLKSWRFDVYRTKLKPEDTPALTELVWVAPDPEAAGQAFQPLKAVAEGVFATRHCVSEPPNVMYPATLAEEARAQLEPLGVRVTVLEPARLAEIGMRSLLGVAQGSVHEARVVVMEWKGCGSTCAEGAHPVALVGKGVTFDTGGISLKPGKDMDHMKYDMAGAGAVIGTMKALALRKARTHVVGIVGLVENMPDGNAQRPGDIVRSLSGQTIEILNTDAEGRLVLCDLLTWVQQEYKPVAVADIATLTGAITVALGEEHAGLFSNDDGVAEALTQAGLKTGERVWRFPLMEAYDRMINSTVADMKNISGGGPGSITAAQFLQRFVQPGVKWAHLDIAGMAWNHTRDKALAVRGATGYGVRLLNQWIADAWEHA